jgi:catechol 2,3-dioxygenase-like lactoylglutathione lyase family enzyme
MINWFSDSLGGEAMKFMGSIPAVKYGDIVVLAMKAAAEPAPTIGRAIDHIGFGVADMDELAKKLKDKGVKFTTEPRALGAAKVAFIEGPSGIRIELIQSAPRQ